MEKYEIGQVIDNFRGRSEGVQFDISDEGGTLMVFFSSPTAKEIEQFSAGKKFEIRFVELHGQIIITVKIGDLPWMDAPYSPHLSEHLTRLEMPDYKSGLGLTVMLVDSVTGAVKSLRIIGLSPKFTRDLFKAVAANKARLFDKQEYDATLEKIFAAYSTNKLASMALSYCKVN